MAKRCLKVGRNWKSEARNLPPCGCKSMVEGLRNMLNVFINLLCTYIMLINYYSSKPTSLRCHLMAKRCLKVGRNWKSEARNLPPCGCKSMVEGLRNMLNVLINLLCTYIMPNKQYYSKPTSLRCHLMAKRCLKVGRNWKSEARNLPPCGCKSMMEGLRNMLNVLINLFCTYIMPNKQYYSKPTSLMCHLMAKRCLKVGRNWKSEARNLPPCGCKSMMEGLRNMLNVLINLLCTYIMPNKQYYSKPTSLRCHLMAKRCLKVGRNWKSEARNLPPCGCKSMVEGPTIMLGVSITLLYTHIMPNIRPALAGGVYPDCLGIGPNYSYKIYVLYTLCNFSNLYYRVLIDQSTYHTTNAYIHA